MAKPKDNALAFVGQIKTEHKAVLKADGEALKHAIECGKYLNLAKENVVAAKGKWGKWRDENIPEISQQTASLYMRLAENEDQAAKCTSIRQADELLRALSSNSRSNTSDKSHGEATDDAATDEADNADEANNALLARKGASPDLTATLQNLAVDEVCTALISAWDEQHIRELCDRLRDHFTKSVIERRTPATTAQPRL
jgi:hypothetical protein